MHVGGHDDTTIGTSSDSLGAADGQFDIESMTIMIGRWHRRHRRLRLQRPFSCRDTYRMPALQVDNFCVTGHLSVGPGVVTFPSSSRAVGVQRFEPPVGFHHWNALTPSPPALTYPTCNTVYEIVGVPIASAYHSDNDFPMNHLYAVPPTDLTILPSTLGPASYPIQPSVELASPSVPHVQSVAPIAKSSSPRSQKKRSFRINQRPRTAVDTDAPSSGAATVPRVGERVERDQKVGKQSPEPGRSGNELALDIDRDPGTVASDRPVPTTRDDEALFGDRDTQTNGPPDAIPPLFDGDSRPLDQDLFGDASAPAPAPAAEAPAPPPEGTDRKATTKPPVTEADTSPDQLVEPIRTATMEDHGSKTGVEVPSDVESPPIVDTSNALLPDDSDSESADAQSATAVLTDRGGDHHASVESTDDVGIPDDSAADLTVPPAVSDRESVSTTTTQEVPAAALVNSENAGFSGAWLWLLLLPFLLVPLWWFYRRRKTNAVAESDEDQADATSAPDVETNVDASDPVRLKTPVVEADANGSSDEDSGGDQGRDASTASVAERPPIESDIPRPLVEDRSDTNGAKSRRIAERKARADQMGAAIAAAATEEKGMESDATSADNRIVADKIIEAPPSKDDATVDVITAERNELAEQLRQHQHDAKRLQAAHARQLAERESQAATAASQVVQLTKDLASRDLRLSRLQDEQDSAAAQHTSMVEEANRTAREKEVVEKQLESRQSYVAELEDTLAKAREELAARNSELQTLASEGSSASDKIQTLMAAVDTSGREASDLKRRLAEQESRNEANESRVSTLLAELSARETQQRKQTAEQSELATQLTKIASLSETSSREKVTLERQLLDQQNRTAEVERQLSALQDELNAQNVQLQQRRRERDELAVRLEQTMANSEASAREKTALFKETEQQRDQVAMLENQKQSLKNDLAVREAEIEASVTERQDLSDQLVALTDAAENSQRHSIATERRITEQQSQIKHAKDQLASLRVQLSARDGEIASLAADKDHLTGQFATLTSTLETTTHQKSVLERQVAEQKSAAAGFEEQLAMIRSELLVRDTEAEAQAIERGSLATQVATLSGAVEASAREKAGLERQLAEQQSRASDLENQLSTLRGLLSDRESELRDLAAARSDADTRIATLMGAIDVASSEASALETKLADQTLRVDNAEPQLRKLREDVSARDAQIKELVMERNAAGKQLSEAKMDIERVNHEAAGQNAKLEEVEAQSKQLESKLSVAAAELSAKSERVDALASELEMEQKRARALVAEVRTEKSARAAAEEQFEQLELKLAATLSEKATVAADLEKEKAVVTRLKSEVLDSHARVDQTKADMVAEIEQSRDALNRAEADGTSARAEMEGVRAALEQAQAELAGLRNEHAKLDRQLVGKVSQLEAATENAETLAERLTALESLRRNADARAETLREKAESQDIERQQALAQLKTLRNDLRKQKSSLAKSEREKIAAHDSCDKLKQQLEDSKQQHAAEIRRIQEKLDATAKKLSEARQPISLRVPKKADPTGKQRSVAKAKTKKKAKQTSPKAAPAKKKPTRKQATRRADVVSAPKKRTSKSKTVNKAKSKRKATEQSTLDPPTTAKKSAKKSVKKRALKKGGKKSDKRATVKNKAAKKKAAVSKRAVTKKDANKTANKPATKKTAAKKAIEKKKLTKKSAAKKKSAKKTEAKKKAAKKSAAKKKAAKKPASSTKRKSKKQAIKKHGKPQSDRSRVTQKRSGVEKRSRTSNRDRLTRIEGIGLKVEAILQAAGINSFKKLAAAKKKMLSQLLERAGSPYHMMDPSTWARQAKLAEAGRWEELDRLQKNLEGGVRRKRSGS